MGVNPEGLLVKISSRLGRWAFPLRKMARDRFFKTIRLGYLLKRDLFLLMTMRSVEVVPTPGTFYRDGVLLV
jgi:hypothetical protein